MGLFILWQKGSAPFVETTATSTIETGPASAIETTTNTMKTTTSSTATVPSTAERAYQDAVKPQDAVSQYINQTLVDQGFSGTVLVYHKGQVTLHLAFGYADQEKRIKNALDTQYCIASIQKGQTAFLLMQAVANGKLSLNESLADFYPTVVTGETVTLKEMLNMCSGLGLDTDILYHLPAESSEATVAFALNNIYAQSSKDFSYQPVNYILLAGILEQVYQKSYQELFEAAIIKSMQLTETSFGMDENPQQAQAYSASGELTTPGQAAFARELGTGNVFMSARDLFVYYESVLKNEQLSEALRDQMWATFPDESYAGGLYHREGYFHGHGVKNNYEPTLDFSNDGQNAVVLLANKREETTDLNKLCDQFFAELVAE